MAMDMDAKQTQPNNAEPTNLNITARRLISALSVGVGLAALVTCVSVAGFARSSNPDLAAAIAPFDAVAKAERAYSILEQGTAPSAIKRARAMAVEALQRDPTAVAAARTIGLIEHINGRHDLAERAFLYAEKMTRRDEPTQIWLINSQVRRGNVEGALTHIDRVLRTSTLADAAVMPVLVAATEDSLLIRPIARRAAANPVWWSLFTAQLIAVGKNLDNITELLVIAGNSQERREMAGRVAAQGRYDLARKLFVADGNIDSTSFNGFSQTSSFLPFDWEYINSEGITTDIIRAAGGTGNVYFIVGSGASGDIARRVITTLPGKYTLATAGRITADATISPAWTITCTGSAAEIAQLATDQANNTVDFEVPASDCTTQWLRLRASANAYDVSGTISNVAINPR